MGATASRSSSRKGRGTEAPRHRGTEKKKPDTAQVSGDVASMLAELLALGDQDWVVSCYQKLEQGDRAGDKYRIKLKNRLRNAEERLAVLGFNHVDREAVNDSLKRIEQFFGYNRNLDGSRGVAVFAGQGWLRAVRLPHVLRSRVLVDRTPVVSELVALVEHGTRILVAVADRTSARLFEVGLEDTRELEGVVTPGATPGRRFHGDAGSPGTGEYKFHTRIREEKHRHLARVAEEIHRALRRQSYDGVIVGGIGADAESLLPHLSTAARDKVIGTLRLAPKHATAAEIREQAMALWSEHADAASADALGELGGLTSSGWSVDGVEPTLRALSLGQVRTLIVDPDAVVAGYRFPASGRLSTSSSGLESEGQPVAVADVLDDAMEDALRQRARVAVARSDGDGTFDQLAAILRFRITPK